MNAKVKTTATTEPATFTSAEKAAEKLFEIANRRRVVAQVRRKDAKHTGVYTVCSRSKARRLGFEIVVTNYS